jgi:hypothetical protein
MRALLGKNVRNVADNDGTVNVSATKVTQYILEDTLFVVKNEDDKDVAEKRLGVRTVLFPNLAPAPNNIISFSEQMEAFIKKLVQEHQAQQLSLNDMNIELLIGFFNKPFNNLALFELQEKIRNDSKSFGYSEKKLS